MKKILGLLVIIFFVFSSCKTTPEKPQEIDEIENAQQSENTTETTPSNEQSDGDLSKPYGLADLPPVFEVTENQDEFFYGDELVFDDAVVNVLPQDDNDTTQIDESDVAQIDESDATQNKENNVTQIDESNSSQIPEKIDELSQREKIEENVENETEFKSNTADISNENSVDNEIAQTNDIENTKTEILKNVNNQNNNQTSINQNKVNNPTENIKSDIVNQKIPQQENKTITQKNTPVDNQKIQIQSTDTVKTESENIDEAISESQNEEIIPSRTVNAKVNDLISFKYPGKGWIYLGETEQKNLVQYKNKQNLTNQVEFLIQAINEGETILHFYKMDTINNSYIDDYCKLIINNTSTSSQIIEAPSFSYEQYLLKNSLNKIEDDKNSVTNEISKEEISPISNLEQNNTDVIEEEPEVMLMNDIQDEEIELSASDLLTLAYKNYNDKQFEEAYENISKYLNLYEDKIDEALLLKGQILEEPSSIRNIREALVSYEQILSEYPQSDLWEKANQRIQYIKRFYFNIH